MSMSAAKRAKVDPQRDGELPQADMVAHRNALFVASKEAIDAAVAASDWKTVAALNRVNALSCLKSAEHGWPGASFSCCELLMALHMRCQGVAECILSKGHAAAMQYATLYATGEMTADQLTLYKKGEVKGPEAHADLICDTGSLGQCLSTAAGMAMASPSKRYPLEVNADVRNYSDGVIAHQRYALVMGDGELQEGQCYEAFMTLKHHKLTNVTTFVDLNGFQSDNKCAEIMAIYDLEAVLTGFGFAVVKIDGHDSDKVQQAWAEAEGKHVVIIATTTKGGGTKHMPTMTHPVTGMVWQPWHTKIPTWELYATIIDELLHGSANSPTAAAAWAAHLADPAKLGGTAMQTLPNTHRPGQSKEGTGKAFGEKLVAKMQTDTKIALVCADLAGSCGINGQVGKERYYEVGVAEQDGVGFAAGLALGGGMLPVFNTYSNFLKRCFENIFINIAEEARCIYAGHYSGLCYHTDGKSHQSINDASIFQGMPSMVVVDPVSAKHAAACADYLTSAAFTLSAYVRLRRTPCTELEPTFDAAAAGKHPVNDLVVLPGVGGAVGTLPEVLFVAMGTQGTKLAWESQSSWATAAAVVVVPSLNAIPNEAWAAILSGGATPIKTIVTVEDDAGALKNYVSSVVLAHACDGGFGTSRPPKVVAKTVNAVGPSFRTLPACLEHFGFTPAALKTFYDAGK